jgi:hypothetical protein
MIFQECDPHPALRTDLSQRERYFMRRIET